MVESGIAPLSERESSLRRGAVLLLHLAAIALFASWVTTMATTSLWTDEIYTVLHFSGEGPLRVVTDYKAPNNHVLFNLLNSLLPARTSVNPLRARFLSFVFVAIGLFAGWRFLWKRGLSITAGVFLFLVAANDEFLDQTLQARGYGLLVLIVAWTCVVGEVFLATGSLRPLATIGILSALGVYTVPTYAFFAVVLFGLLFGLRRTRPVVFTALASGALAILLYAPLWKQMADQAKGYSTLWGREYGTVKSIATTILRYVSPWHPSEGAWAIGAAILYLVLLGIGAARYRAPSGTRERDAVWLFAGASFGFLLVCRLVETPLIRTTSFVAIPLLLTTALVGARLTERFLPRSRALVPEVAGILLLLLLFFRPMTQGRFLPFEQWAGIARFVHQTFPERTPIHSGWASDFLEMHIEANRRLAGFDEAALRRGDLLILDNSLEKEMRYARNGLSGVSFRFPQRRSDDQFQELFFGPPIDRGIQKIQKRSDRWVIRPASGRLRSLVFLKSGDGRGLSGGSGEPGKWRAFGPGDVVVDRDLVAVALGDREVAEIQIQSPAGVDAFEIREACVFRTD